MNTYIYLLSHNCSIFYFLQSFEINAAVVKLILILLFNKINNLKIHQFE